MTKSIFITRRIPVVGIKILEDNGYLVEVNPNDRILTKEELVDILSKKSYDAILSLITDHIEKEVLEAAKTVKIVSNYATGFDNIDIALAKELGIVVTNAPAPLSTDAVAQHAIGFLLALSDRLLEADDFVRKGKYTNWEPMSFIGTDLSGKTIGIVGAGRIGERVAHYAHSLGLKVVYTNEGQNKKLEKDYDAVFCPSIDELLPIADFITLHVPLLPSTEHLINDTRLKLMKPTSFLINTSRGPVVDEVALVKALNEKTIAGAALDVFEFEPNLTKGLVDLPNVVLTPHIASSTVEARNQMAEIAAANIVDFFDGKEVKNIVNK